MEKVKTGITRRDFLKDAGLVFGGAAAVGAVSYVGGGIGGGVQTAYAQDDSDVSTMSESVKPIPPAEVPASWDFEADVVVCGGGMSGLMTTCKAAAYGASVITLEKNGIPGGDGQWAEATMGDYTMTPKLIDFLRADEGMLSPKDGKNHRLMVKMVQRWQDMLDFWDSMGVVRTRNVNALNGFGALMPYMEYYGENFLGQSEFYEPAVPESLEYPDDIHRWHPHEARGFTNAMYWYAINNNVGFKLSTPATALVSDGGRVVGVKAHDKQNEKDIFVKAKAVVLATGGLIGNHAMFEYYTPPEKRKFVAKYAGMPSAEGDGIRMAQGIGAFVEEMGEFDIWDGGCIDPHYANGPRAVYNAATQLGRQKSLQVNKLAKRFTDEGRYSGNCYTYNGFQRVYQLDATTFTLFDTNCISREDLMAKFDPMACEEPVPWFDEDFERQLAEGIIMKADSLDELAGLMGVDAAALKETVDRYNSMCDKGEDTDMGKQPKYLVPIKTAPFYTVKDVGGIYWHHGGGMVYNESLQVVDRNWQPIGGLYCAGQNGRALCQIANAAGSGFLAGENAAREALGEPIEF
jgi:fumarate reductase flavoprotein subunit